MTRSGTGWPEHRKYRTVPVQLLAGQYDAIPDDEPVSLYIREALEERLRREVPGYEHGGDHGDGNVPGNAADDPGAAADPGA